MKDGDGFFCLNFRADRARQILRALGEPGFSEFDIGRRPDLTLLGMVDYSKDHDRFMRAAYPKRPVVNTIGSWVAQHGLRQFRLAETEKYPHVTFFLNGGKETPEEGEDRYMAPSPKVATYDLAPEMSAAEVSDHLVQGHRGAIRPDRRELREPRHGGAYRRSEGRDQGLRGGGYGPRAGFGGAGKDRRRDDRHRRSRQLRNDDRPGNRRPPYRAYAEPGAGDPRRRARGRDLRDGRLADLAPTLLQLMGLEPPPEMTGESLLA
jgi:2,3-bisphosphoglycerate-independent phosphoglycerate mutase